MRIAGRRLIQFPPADRADIRNIRKVKQSCRPTVHSIAPPTEQRHSLQWQRKMWTSRSDRTSYRLAAVTRDNNAQFRCVCANASERPSPTELLRSPCNPLNPGDVLILNFVSCPKRTSERFLTLHNTVLALPCNDDGSLAVNCTFSVVCPPTENSCTIRDLRDCYQRADDVLFTNTHSDNVVCGYRLGFTVTESPRRCYRQSAGRHWTSPGF